MNTNNLQKGQSLIEILFAIAIFTIGVVTIGYLIIDARSSLHYATDLTRARLLAAEGIEAVNSMRAGGYDLLTAGDYGLELDGGVWTLSSSSDEIGKYTRTISIQNIDVGVKEVTSQVAWTVSGVKERDVSYTTRFSNWMQVGGEAEDFQVALNNAAISASNTALTGLWVKNTGTADITLTDMKLQWDTPALLERVTLDSFDIFLASTSASIASGENIDVADHQIAAFTGFRSLDSIEFDGDVSGTNFILSFTFQDESVRSVYLSL